MTRLLVTAVVVTGLVAVACQRDASPAGDEEPPTLVVTSWTDASELFMEHPPFVAGQTVRFAVP